MTGGFLCLDAKMLCNLMILNDVFLIFAIHYSFDNYLPLIKSHKLIIKTTFRNKTVFSKVNDF